MSLVNDLSRQTGRMTEMKTVSRQRVLLGQFRHRLPDDVNHPCPRPASTPVHCLGGRTDQRAKLELQQVPHCPRWRADRALGIFNDAAELAAEIDPLLGAGG